MNTDKVGRVAPIALFVYNRPWHTRQTVEALKANLLAPKSDLHIFADGAKSESVQEEVDAAMRGNIILEPR
jgi:hypothetical protein